MAAIILAATLGGCGASERLFVSCQNHRKHLDLDLTLRLHEDERIDPPHQPSVSGYEMIARYAGGRFGALNCNHGAPGFRIGGWQAVNLTPEQWLALNRLWTDRGHQGFLPFSWCGKPNPLGKRVFSGLLRNPDGRWVIMPGVLSEVELRDTIGELNACLSEMGVQPVAVDVPDGVRWDSFESEDKK